MTVKELMDSLSRANPSAEVILSVDDAEGYNTPAPAEFVTTRAKSTVVIMGTESPA